MWKYYFDFEKYPAENITFTEWSTLDYPFEKVLRSLTLDVDTGGVTASVDVQADGVTDYTTWTLGGPLDRNRHDTVRPDPRTGDR